MSDAKVSLVRVLIWLSTLAIDAPPIKSDIDSAWLNALQDQGPSIFPSPGVIKCLVVHDTSSIAL
jgi:hypothetical protein